MDEQRIFNKRLFGFVADMLVFVIITFWFFRADTALGVLSIALTVIQLFYIFVSPIYYVFTDNSLTIKYFFGLEENIPWRKVDSIREHHRFSHKRYVFLKWYKIDYRSDGKTHFLMEGTVSKNKKITELLKEYCPKKLEEKKTSKR